MRSWHFAFVALALALGTITAAQQRTEQRDMGLVGYNDLQARSAYQPVIHKHGDRWIAYIGHHGGVQPNPLTGKPESNGTSIVDVTNPRQPKYLAHVPGDEGQGEAGGAQMVRLCNGSDLPKADKTKVYLLRSLGNVAHETWDVTDPSRPARLTTVVSGLKGTHKSWWECDTGIAYLVSGDPSWRTDRMTKIYDLSDPSTPVFIRDFGVAGQQPGSTVMPVPTGLHGPISLGPKLNRVYFAHGTGQAGILQIVDREKLLNGPKEPTEANLLYPQISRVDFPPDVGAHTAFPLLGMPLAEFARQKLPANPAIRSAAGLDHDHGVYGGPKGEAHRDMIAIVSETTGNECFEARQLVRHDGGHDGDEPARGIDVDGPRGER